MPCAHIGQRIHCIHFLCAQRLLGRILHHIFLAVGLYKPLGCKGITVAVLHLKAFGILALIGFQFIKRGKCDRGQALIHLSGFKYGSVDVSDVFYIHSGIQSICDLHNTLFAHTIHQQICLRIQQNGPLHRFRPVVVMTKPPQACLNAADQNRHILVSLANEIAINHSCIIRPLAHNPTGGKGICFAFMLGNRIMVHHRIHITAGYQETKTRPTENINRVRLFPIRLRNDTYAVAMLFQNSADDRMTEGGVINISIADHIHKIATGPATVQHILLTNRKKAHKRPPKVFY